MDFSTTVAKMADRCTGSNMRNAQLGKELHDINKSHDASASRVTPQGRRVSSPAAENYPSRYEVSLNGREPCSAYLQIAALCPNPREQTSIRTVCLHYTRRH